MKGYTGKVLFVNLTQRSWYMETIPDEIYEGYLSGVGLGAHLLFQRIPRGADPLGPQNAT
ncbi:MAG TPA: aldehyde ferredoxin oxidoreductase N-terminal domain-containing protein [Anaerolineales bacterium]